MRRITRSQVDSWLLLGLSVGLFGCPLLLDDDFSLAPFTLPDAGDPCIGPTCHVPYSNIGGSSGEGSEPAGGAAGSAEAGNGGVGGSSSGAAGSSGASGSGGVAGSSGAGNGGGSAGSGSAGSGSAGTGSAGAGSAGASGGEEACRTLELIDGSHNASTNCLGIAGTNLIATDSGTLLTLSYEDGDPCFSGTIAAAPDWGATFELELAPGSGAWNATAAGVTGFEFAYRGSPQPPSVRVIYKQTGSSTDFCRTITPGTTEVPFSAGHPGCTSSGGVVNATQLDELILAILPQTGSSYAVDFCVQIRALD